MEPYTDLLLYAARVVAAIVVLSGLAVPVIKLFHWYVDKFKRENRAFLEFQVSYLRENSLYPCFILDRQLRINSTNYAFRRLFSAGKEHFEGKNWFRLVEPNELAPMITMFKEAIQQKSGCTYTVPVALPDGTKLRMLITAEPFIYAGRTRAFIGTAKIVRERK